MFCWRKTRLGVWCSFSGEGTPFLALCDITMGCQKQHTLMCSPAAKQGQLLQHQQSPLVPRVLFFPLCLKATASAQTAGLTRTETATSPESTRTLSGDKTQLSSQPCWLPLRLKMKRNNRRRKKRQSISSRLVSPTALEGDTWLVPTGVCVSGCLLQSRRAKAMTSNVNILYFEQQVTTDFITLDWSMETLISVMTCLHKAHKENTLNN